MALTERSDSELLLEFKNPVTKERAYTTLIKKYQEKLYWHIRRLVVDHDDANDVLQNVFIRVWNALENSSAEANASSVELNKAGETAAREATPDPSEPEPASEPASGAAGR